MHHSMTIISFEPFNQLVLLICPPKSLVGDVHPLRPLIITPEDAENNAPWSQTWHLDFLLSHLFPICLIYFQK